MSIVPGSPDLADILSCILISKADVRPGLVRELMGLYSQDYSFAGPEHLDASCVAVMPWTAEASVFRDPKRSH